MFVLLCKELHRHNFLKYAALDTTQVASFTHFTFAGTGSIFKPSCGYAATVAGSFGE
jgi:hypothetical protein